MSVTEIYLIAVVHVGVFVTLGYALDYGTGSNWRDNEAGRPLLSKALSMALLFLVAVLGYWWPFPGYAYIYAGVVTFVVGSVAYQWAVMRRLRHKPSSHF